MTIIAAPLSDEARSPRSDASTPSVPPRASGAVPVAAQAFRYFVASAVALALDAGLLWLAVERLAMPVWLGGALGYSFGLVLVYLLSVHWVFPQRIVADTRREFGLFAALGVIGLFVNASTLTVATACGFTLPWAKGLAAAIGFTTNFASRKLLLFTARRA